jgi:hypothetical protein
MLYYYYVRGVVMAKNFVPKAEKEKKVAGRPRTFTSAAELYRKGMEYVSMCQEKGEPILITGLCIHLGVWRERLIEYETGDYDDHAPDHQFSQTIKKLKSYCENYAETIMLTSRFNTAGAIFALKNYGWRDVQELQGSFTASYDGIPDTQLDVMLSEYEKRRQSTETLPC